MSPASIKARLGPDHHDAQPRTAASTDAPAGSPAPRPAATNASGTSRHVRATPSLYAAGVGPPAIKNTSAGRQPPSNTGVLT